MSIVDDLKQLIKKYENNDEVEYNLPYRTVGKSAPREWRDLPVDAAEGRRFILETLRNHQDLPWNIISQANGHIHFMCGPIEKCSMNPNGHSYTTASIHFIDVLYATHGVKVEGDRK